MYNNWLVYIFKLHCSSIQVNHRIGQNDRIELNNRIPANSSFEFFYCYIIFLPKFYDILLISAQNLLIFLSFL